MELFDPPPRFTTMSKRQLMEHFNLSTRGVQLMAQRKNWRRATMMAGQIIFQLPESDLADQGDGRRRKRFDPRDPIEVSQEIRRKQRQVTDTLRREQIRGYSHRQGRGERQEVSQSFGQEYHAANVNASKDRLTD